MTFTKKLLIVILGLLLACGGESVESLQPEPSSAPPPDRTGEPSADLKVFTDGKEGYRISYPSDWTLSDKSRGSHMIRADLSFGRDTGIQIRVHKGITSDLETYVDRYLESFRKDMEGHWKGEMEEESRDCGRIGHNRGCKVCLTFERPDGSNWYFVEYLFPIDDRVVVLQCGTPLEERDRYESVLDGIAESLEFLER